MKLSFRTVTISIIIALAAVFVGQIYWLVGLYSSIRQETNTNINVAIEAADRKELSYRMSLLKNDKGNKDRSISVHDSARNDSRANHKKVRVNFYFDMTMLDRIMRNMHGAIHNAIDTVFPIKISVYGKILTKEFRNRGMDVHVYAIDFVNTKTHHVIHYRPQSMNQKKEQCVTYYNSNGHYKYRVYITPTMDIVLWRMAGILITTLLIVTLLSISFWYLIHVILQQRTLEEMKDDFTNNMTHELKTPIAVAYAANDALLNFGADMNMEKRKKYLTIAKEQMQNLSGLVEQILSMSMERRKTFSLHYEDIAIKELVSHLVEQYVISQSVHIGVNIYPEELIIHADRTHLRNMIANLIDNAVKYSGDNKQITINVYSKDVYIYIEVIDNGIGLTSEQQQHIFDKFYRVPTGNLHTVKGFGIGLFYVKTIAEKHAGSVFVKSVPGNGSTFVIKLPQNIKEL